MRNRRRYAFAEFFRVMGMFAGILMIALSFFAIAKSDESVAAASIKQLEQQINTLQAEVYELSEAVDTVTASQAEVLNDVTDVLAKVEYFGDTVYRHVQGETGEEQQ
jgi:conjugal transfer/entry exclusion protein